MFKHLRHYLSSRAATSRPMTILLSSTGAVFVMAVGAIVWVSTHRQPLPTPETPPINVSVATVKPLPEVADTFVQSAGVEAYAVVDVAGEVAGRIQEVLTSEGQNIESGAPILCLNTDLLKAEYDRAAAQAQYDKNDFERLDLLFKGGAATGRDRDGAEVRMQVSRAVADEVKARLDRACVHAPLTGVLNKLPLKPGEYVNIGAPVAQIVQLDKVKVVVNVSEQDVAFIHVGDKAAVLATVKGESRELSGQVSYISEIAEPSTRTSRLEITVENKDHLLRAGQIVLARLTRRTLNNVIMVPLLAVVPLEEGKAVFVVENGKAKDRLVELGLLKESDVQITKGLKAGDQLIVSGQRLVGPDQIVKIVPLLTQPIEKPQ